VEWIKVKALRSSPSTTKKKKTKKKPPILPKTPKVFIKDQQKARHQWLVPGIPVIWDHQDCGLGWANVRLHLQNNQSKKGWRSSSSGKNPCLASTTPRVQTEYHQKKVDRVGARDGMRILMFSITCLMLKSLTHFSVIESNFHSLGPDTTVLIMPCVSLEVMPAMKENLIQI
jgi:hypothetical protein